MQLATARRQVIVPAAAPDPLPSITTTEDLRHRLARAKQTEDLSNTELGRALGYKDGTQVSKFLNDNIDFDLPAFEDRASAWLRTLTRQRLAAPAVILQTSVVRQLAGFLEDLLATKLIGLVTGPSGIGLSVAALEYSRTHATSIHLTATAAHRTGRGLQSLLFSQLKTRGYDGCTSRWDYITAQLAGSDRLLVVDNAHRLLGDGLDWFYDLLDATGCPGALLGNDPLLARVRAAGDRSSRTWPAIQVTLKSPKQVAAGLVDAHLPEHAETLVPLAAAHLARRHSGHLRGVVALLRLTRQFIAHPQSNGDPATAWHTALQTSLHARIE